MTLNIMPTQNLLLYKIGCEFQKHKILRIDVRKTDQNIHPKRARNIVNTLSDK